MTNYVNIENFIHDRRNQEEKGLESIEKLQFWPSEDEEILQIVFLLWRKSST